MKDLGYQKALIQDWDTLNSLRESIIVYLEFIEMGESVEEELAAETDKFILQLEALELKNMLKEEDDHRDAVVQFSPGAGGQRVKIGLKCYIECIHGGPIKTDIRCL